MMTGWDYQARANEVDAERAAEYAARVAMRQAQAKIERPIPDGLLPSQIDLFQANADDFDYTNQFISGLPDFLAKYFARRYKKTFQQQGRAAANRWIRHTMRGVDGNKGILARVEGVMARYPLAPNINLARRDVVLERNGRTIHLRKNVGLEEFGRHEVEAFAIEASSEMFQLFAEFREKYLTARLTDSEIDEVMGGLYHKLAYRTQQYGLKAPNWNKFTAGKLTDEQRDIAMSKMLDKDWWVRKLWRLRNEMREHLAIAVGQVQKGASPYASRECVNMWRDQKRKNTDYIKQMELINADDEEERIDLKDMFYKTVSNPAIRRCELMVRMRGFEELAKRMGYVGEFYTLTAPSAYHASAQQGFNSKWNFSNPKDTQRYLCNVWAKVRASLARQDIKLFGFRVAEPHHDGTPHWHMLFFMLPEQIDAVRATFLRYALEIDGDEAGATTHRFTVKAIDEAKGSATGYIAKYIAKNIDGYAMDDELDDETGEKCKDLAKNVSAWASRWRIRQFQQVGGSPVTVYRELRRLKGQVIAQDAQLTALIRACDEGEWDLYTELQGGAFVKRADLLARAKYEDREPNTYGEISRKVVGVFNQLKAGANFVCTRLKSWILRKKSTTQTQPQAEAAIHSVRSTPWSSVNNCTEGKVKNDVEKFLLEHADEVKRLDFALKLRGIGRRWITDTRKKRLILGEAISFMGNNRIRFNGAEIIIYEN